MPPDAAHTDWRQILALYDQLMAIAPSPLVALNRAVARGRARRARRWPCVSSTNSRCPRYHLFHAVRADLLRRLGRESEAAAAYRSAIEGCGNAREREFLQRQLDAANATT